MSEENVEIVRRAWTNASQADPAIKLDALDPDAIAAIVESLDPEVEFHEDPRFPEAGVYRGVAAVRGYWDGFTENFEQFTFEVEDFVDIGEERVLVLLGLTTRGRGSGATVDVRPGWIFTVRNRRVARIDAIFDRNDALQAAGLLE